MNNDLEQFSEERLMKLSETKGFPPLGDVRALARIALSAKQAKPVGYAVNNVFFRQYMTASLYSCEMKHPIETFYITPQPAHTEQVIPSEIPKVPHNGVMAYKKDGSIYSTNYARGWNDCVQAMLAAAPKPESE